MARVTLNVAFKSLHGKVGDAIFYQRYGKQIMRPYVAPSNPDTPAQRERRGEFRKAVHAWQALAVEEKEEWKREARRMRRSGYNLFISYYLGGTAITEDMKRRTVRAKEPHGRAIFLRTPGKDHSPSNHLPLSAVSSPYNAGNRVSPPFRPPIFRR